MSAGRWAAIALAFALGLAASYGLALAGEPSSAWLWRWALPAAQPAFVPPPAMLPAEMAEYDRLERECLAYHAAHRGAAPSCDFGGLEDARAWEAWRRGRR